MLTKLFASLLTIFAVVAILVTGCQQSPSNEPAIGGSASSDDEPNPWVMQDSGVTASLRGICAVDDEICWVTGAAGTVLRTVDGGLSWSNVGPREYPEADFRDIHASNEKRAIIMAAGNPDLLLKTEDGGESWKKVYEHEDSAAFFDGIVFDRDGQKGWLMGDPIAGRMFLMATSDAGNTWKMMDDAACPMLPDGVAGFAASGTNLCLAGTDRLIVGLGGENPSTAGSSTATVAIIDLEGGAPKVVNTPITASPSSGIFSVCSVDDAGQHLVAVGGNYEQIDSIVGNCSISLDGGQSWKAGAGDSPDGFRSVILAIPDDSDKKILIATGPQGTNVSRDGGNSWEHASTSGFHTMSFGSSTGNLWAAGSEGRIARWKEIEVEQD